MTTVYANQSCNVSDFMASLCYVLQNMPGLPTGVVVKEWYGEERPRYEAEPMIYCRVYNDEPFKNDGAGRWGHRYQLTVEVINCTRFAQDIAGDHSQWSRDSARGHWPFRQLVVDVLQDQNIWYGYDPTNNYKPIAPILTVAPLQQVESPAPKKGQLGKNDQGWGESSLFFQTWLVQKLTVPNTVPPGE